jgi:hypothetical protein
MYSKSMSLKNLASKLDIYHKSQNLTPSSSSQDADIACTVVDLIFKYVDMCLRENKSKYQVSLFAKSFIRGILNDNVKEGINSFVTNMNDNEIKAMLDDIQKELNKRKL